jgi:hypothetical protein
MGKYVYKLPHATLFIIFMAIDFYCMSTAFKLITFDKGLPPFVISPIYPFIVVLITNLLIGKVRVGDTKDMDLFKKIFLTLYLKLIFYAAVIVLTLLTVIIFSK